MVRHWLGSFLFLAAVGLLAPQDASAATFTVTVTIDDDDFLPGNGACETTSGGGVCTLRAAIQEANALAGEDTIVLPADTIMLTRAGADDTALNGDLDITGRLTIRGVTSATTIVDGNGLVTSDRVFEVRPGAVVTMSQVTLKGGRGANGAGVLSQGSLTMLDCRIENNTATGTGGGISSLSGALTATRCWFDGNSAGLDGGGISASNDLTVTDSLIEDNRADSNNDGSGTGGGIKASAQLILSSSTVRRNSARYGGGISSSSNAVRIEGTSVLSNHASLNGGGISGLLLNISDSVIAWNTADAIGGGINAQVFCLPSCSDRPLTLRRITIAHNQAITSGGGIAVTGVRMTLQDSTISRNGAGSGGGIANEDAIAVLINATVSNNSVRGSGGGIYTTNAGCNLAGQTCATQLFNATIAANTVDDNANGTGVGGGVFIGAGAYVTATDSLIGLNINDDPDSSCGPSCVIDNFHADDCSGTLRSRDYNLIQTTTNCAITGLIANNITGLDPKLKSLGDYGGPTETRLPQRDSRVLDKANPAGCKDLSGVDLTTDQRGMPRPKGGRCDIGAVEGSDTARAFLPGTRRAAPGDW